jgi:tetratricopeptide (TPR) repeat protein
MTELAGSQREELDLVLASIDDLEAEYEAGDLDEADYRALKSDYTTRAARLIRALEGVPGDTPAAAEPVVARSWRRMVAWTVLVVVVAGLAGVLIADFSGSRGDGGLTGDIRETVRQRKFEASQLLGTDPDRALEIYDEVLVDEPSDAEALAYRGWLTRLDGDPEGAQPFVEDAVLSDPEYPDALVFAAAIAMDLGDAATAAGHLAALDALDAPPFIEQLVRGQGLRIRIVEALLFTGEPDSFETSGLTMTDVNLAADSVLSTEPDRGILLYEEVLAQRPDDVEVLSYAGLYQAFVAIEVGTEALGIMQRGYDDLSRALELVPDDPQALVFRAWVGFFLDEFAQSRLDLAAYDDLDVERDDLENFIFQFGLRDALG